MLHLHGQHWPQCLAFLCSTALDLVSAHYDGMMDGSSCRRKLGLVLFLEAIQAQLQSWQSGYLVLMLFMSLVGGFLILFWGEDLSITADAGITT